MIFLSHNGENEIDWWKQFMITHGFYTAFKEIKLLLSVHFVVFEMIS